MEIIIDDIHTNIWSMIYTINNHETMFLVTEKNIPGGVERIEQCKRDLFLQTDCRQFCRDEKNVDDPIIRCCELSDQKSRFTSQSIC